MSQDLVKSAARALEILEVFAQERKHMSSAQLGAVLGYPKSSLSVLLRSLVTQGYLSYGDRDQKYFPTLRLTRLGEWIPVALLGSDALLPMLEKLRDQTGETVTLTTGAEFHMRCLHAFIGTHPISLQVEEGVTFPMIGTAIGTMYLAMQDDKTTLDLLSRWAKQHPGKSKSMIAKLKAEVEEARTRGVACAYDVVLPDTGAIAMPIILSEGGEPLIVAVAGLNRRIHQKEASIIQSMRTLIRSLKY